MDIILEVLAATKGKPHLDWVLWAEQNALVLNPAFAFPYSRYDAAGSAIVMYGNPDTTTGGHVNGAALGLCVCLAARLEDSSSVKIAVSS